jgi:O-antigen/teichoic acid export membrane protein
MAEEKQVFWNYLAILVGQFGSSVLAIFTAVITARLLQPEGYGILALFLMVIGLSGTLFIDWPNAAIIRYGKEEFIKTEKIAEVVWARIIIFATTFCTISLSLYLFKDWIVEYIGIETRFFYLIIVYILVSSVAGLSLYVLQAVGKLKVFGIVPFIRSITYFLLLIFIVLKLSSINVVDIILIGIISQIIMIFIVFSTVKLQWFYPPKILRSRIYQIISYAWPMVFGALSAVVIGYIDTIVIKEYLSTADVGIYSIAYMGMTFVSVIILSVVSLLFPLITSFRVQGKINLIKQYIDDLIPQGVFVWSIFVSIVTIIGAIIIPLLFGESYRAATLPFMVLLLGVSFMSIASFYSGVITTFDLLKKMVLVSVLISVLNVIGDLLLVPRMGLVGAATATSLSFLIANVIYVPFLNKSLINKCRKLDSGYKRYFVSVYNIPMLLSLFVCLFVSDWLLKIPIFTLIIVISIIVAKKTGLFKKETLDFIDFIEMPFFLKKGIIRVYRLLI